jgi:hypothetical protein
MTAPVRIQRKREKGFNLQAASRAINGLPAQCVDRSTRWGNPFRVGHGLTMKYADGDKLQLCDHIKNDAKAVAWFRGLCEANLARNPAWYGRHFAQLRGKNLACWCALDAPCHADVLLEIANRPIKCEATS